VSVSSSVHPAVVCRPAVVLPDHEITDASVSAMAQRVLENHPTLLPRVLRIVKSAGIKQRRLVRPLEDTVVPTGFGERNNLFIETSKRLGEQAAMQAMENAGVKTADIDLIITTSCTGVMIPSLDAHLITKLGFSLKTKRLPITELGCAAGTVALSRAREFILAHPGANVLIVAHELCSLTYQPADFNMSALVGALLFGDGVTACVVRGDGQGKGMQLDANESFLFEDSWGYMGFDIRDSGLHLILDKGIPGAVERQIAPVLLGFLDGQGKKKEQIDFFCLHPGGKKVIDEIARVFELAAEDTQASRDCLSEVGNLSSASILVVLKNIFERYTPKAGERGMVVGFGPGFSAEMLLTTWVA
jgi:1,3,6,8-tetrahydroxynaphthalene synthase